MSATVLVVDDCEDDLRLCQRAFKKFDYCFSLTMASSAAAGLASVADRKPDLILLDYNLPDMDGIAFMKKLAASSDTPIPIVMLTGDDSAATAVEAMKHGADDYLVKDTAGRYLKLLPGVVGRVMGAHAQREQLQRLRQEAEDKFRLLFESANDCLLLLSLEGRILDINRIGHARLGYTKAEMLGRNITEFVPPEFVAIAPERFAMITSAGQATFESAYVRKDGSTFPLEVNCRVVELHGEKMLYSIARDITERKRAQMEVLRNQYLLNAAQRLGKLGSWELDLSGGELLWSYEMYRIFEVDPLRFTPSYENFLSMTHPEDRDKVDRAYTQSLQYHQPYDVVHRLLLADGRIKWVREYGTNTFDASGKALRSMGMSQDISDHIVAEAALQRSEANLRAMLDNSPYMAWSKDAMGRYIMINRMYADHLRLVDGSLAVGKTDLDLQPQALAEKFRADDAEVMAARRRKHAEESSFDGKNIRWLETFKTPIIDKQGNVLGTVGFARDITGRKLDEERLLRESENEHRRAELLAQQFGYLLQGSFNEIYMFDAESLRFLLSSEGAEKNLGYTDEELNQLTPLDIYPAFTRDSYEELLAPLRGGEQQSLLFETVQRRKDGTDYPVEVRVQLMDAEPPVFMAVVQDITERRRAESQTREFTAHLQTVREEEKARFAREIHDELGGTLVALKMDASWLSGKLSEVAGMRALQECAKSMSVSLDHMVVATRRIISDMRPAILDDVGLMGAIKWQGAQFQQRTGIECRTECVDDGGHDCEKGMDKTFSINLFRIVQESLTNVVRHSDATKVGVRLHCRAAQVVLTVSDNGHGMPQGHAIAPTSHGLRGMCERARQLGGKITFDTPPGGGFSVTAVLPLPGADKQ